MEYWTPAPKRKSNTAKPNAKGQEEQQQQQQQQRTRRYARADLRSDLQVGNSVTAATQ
jgi:hypothetical protein